MGSYHVIDIQTGESVLRFIPRYKTPESLNIAFKKAKAVADKTNEHFKRQMCYVKHFNDKE